MLYEFKCKATGTVTMTGAVAEQVLRAAGKEPGPQGIFTLEQLGPAISGLQAAVDRERAEGNPARSERSDDGEEEAPRAVSLAQRAWPFIEMLRAAQAAGKVVTWGV